MRCDRCGNHVASHVRFCSQCGAETEPPPLLPNPPDLTPPTLSGIPNRRSRWTPLIFVVACGVLCSGLVLSIVYRLPNAEQPHTAKVPDSVLKAREEDMLKNKLAGEEENRKIRALREAITSRTVVPSEANRLTFVNYAQSVMTDRIVSSSGPSHTVFDLRVPDPLTEETVKAFPLAFANALPDLFEAEISLGFQTIAVTDPTGKRRTWGLLSIAADNRRSYAKKFENDILSQGFSADITTAGPEATTLIVKWVLTTKAQAYQLARNESITRAWKDAGFKRVEITDGYSENWIIALSK